VNRWSRKASGRREKRWRESTRKPKSNQPQKTPRINRSKQSKQRPKNLHRRSIIWLSHRKGEPFGLGVQNRSSSSSVVSVTSCSIQLPFLGSTFILLSRCDLQLNRLIPLQILVVELEFRLQGQLVFARSC